MTAVAAKPPYQPRHVPPTYDAGWTGTELANIARAIGPNRVTRVTKACIAMVTDAVIACDATGGAFSVTLPNPAQVKGMTLTVAKVDASANAVTVAGTVSGVASPTLGAQWKSMSIVSDGTVWIKTAAV